MEIVKETVNDQSVIHHYMTFAEIEKFGAGMPDLYYKDFLDEDCGEEDPGYYVHGDLYEMSQSVIDMLDHFGMVIDFENGRVDFQANADYKSDGALLTGIQNSLEGIVAVFNLVSAAYESYVPGKPGWGPMLPDLGGDDDVDYNSGCPSSVVEVIQEMLNRHYGEGESSQK